MTTVAGARRANGGAPAASGRPRALVIWYSQTGQLRRALEALVEPLADAGYELVWEELRPLRPYPFPWSLRAFLEVFPDAVLGGGCELAAPAVSPDEEFDLVVLGYQVWYLAPSSPVEALFRSDLRRAIAGRPVVTLVACRNMWFSAATRMRRLIELAGGELAGHVAVTDDGPVWATFVTTPRWLLTGRADRFLRIFPPPGIGPRTLAGVGRLGRVLAERAPRIRHERPFAGHETFDVDDTVVVADVLAGLAFRPWAHFVARAGPSGSLRRALAMGTFGAWLTATVPVAMPALALARLPLRRVVRRATRAYVARLAPGEAPRREPLVARG
jgi:hypothetical protein